MTERFTRRSKAVVAAAAVITGAAAVTAYLISRPAPDTRSSMQLQPDDPALLAIGKQVYDAHCASCHGANLQGQPDWRVRGRDGMMPAPPHDASGHTWHHPDDVLFRITKYGVAKAANLKDYKSAMPAYEGVLDDRQIVAVLSWIKAQWPVDIRSKHDTINRSASQ